MNILRKWLGVIFALALTGLATSAVAQPKLKTFDLQGFGAFETFTTGQQIGPVEIKVVNNSPDTKANFNSFRLYAPLGFKILAASAGTNGTRTGLVSAPAIWTTADANVGKSYIAVTSIRPSVGASSADNYFAVSLTVAASCVESTGSWTGQVYSGGDLSGASFEYKMANGDPQTARTSTSSGTGPSCVPKVEFVPDDPNVTGDQSFSPKSQLLASGTATITADANSASGRPVRARVLIGSEVNTGFAGKVKIRITSSPTGYTPSSPSDLAEANVVDGIAEFTPRPTVNTLGFYTMEPVAVPTTVGAASYSGASATILVSNATLDCAIYAGNPPTLQNPADSSFAINDWEVVRHRFKSTTCTRTNYIATVGGADPVTDPNGYQLGNDFFSLVYDVPPDGVLLTHQFESSPYQMVDGQAPAKKVVYCTNGSCASQVDAPGCLSGGIEVTAIPFLPNSTTERHPGCKRSFGWFAVDRSECGLAANSPIGCVRYQFELLEAKDPPWGMTDE